MARTDGRMRRPTLILVCLFGFFGVLLTLVAALDALEAGELDSSSNALSHQLLTLR
jgi:hypothetical protein